MPCRGPDDDEIKALKMMKEQEALQDRFNIATRLFCMVLSAIENRQIDLHVDAKLTNAEVREVLSWWRSHQEWDKQRLVKLKKQAINKLSPDELEALGLNREDEDENE